MTAVTRPPLERSRRCGCCRVAAHAGGHWQGRGGEWGGVSRKGDLEAHLREVTVVGQAFDEAVAAHDLHGDAVGEAICLVEAGLIEGNAV